MLINNAPSPHNAHQHYELVVVGERFLPNETSRQVQAVKKWWSSGEWLLWWLHYDGAGGKTLREKRSMHHSHNS